MFYILHHHLIKETQSWSGAAHKMRQPCWELLRCPLCLVQNGSVKFFMSEMSELYLDPLENQQCIMQSLDDI